MALCTNSLTKSSDLAIRGIQNEQDIPRWFVFVSHPFQSHGCSRGLSQYQSSKVSDFEALMTACQHSVVARVSLFYCRNGVECLGVDK